jgi:hypothetical protein
MGINVTSKAEDLVIDDLGKFGLQCKRFSKKEMRLSKTPDLRVYKAGQFAFFCEVKEVAEDPWSGGLRSDPIFNRLTDDIHTAIAQFDSVNPFLEHPNVLAFVNNDRMCGSLDLIGVTTGLLLTEGGGAAAVYQIYSEGRIRDEKRRIHLYLWYDSFKANKIMFNASDKRHWSRLCSYFNFDPDEIKPIGT